MGQTTAGALTGAGTNIAASAAPTTTPNDLLPGSDDEADDDKPPAVDPTLNEAKRVMVDYLSLLQKNNVALTGTGPRE